VPAVVRRALLASASALTGRWSSRHGSKNRAWQSAPTRTNRTASLPTVPPVPPGERGVAPLTDRASPPAGPITCSSARPTITQR